MKNDPLATFTAPCNSFLWTSVWETGRKKMNITLRLMHCQQNIWKGNSQLSESTIAFIQCLLLEINRPRLISFYILFQNLQNKFQVQESRISLDTMQSIIYRRIKYILYIADKPWWVLHMYSMYVNLYVQSFLHLQKLCFYFYLCIYIDNFLYTPH